MNNKTLIFSTVIIFSLLTLFLLAAKFLGISLSSAEKISLIFSGTAILISVVVFLRTQKTSMMPVLVFVQGSKGIWQLQNVGRGPAITVTVSNKNNEGKWVAILFPPIAAGASLDLDTPEKYTDYGAVYKDINGNVYSSLCVKNINKFFEKNKFPEWEPHITAWRLKEIREDARRMF